MKQRKTILIYSHDPKTARVLKSLFYQNIKNSLVHVAMGHEGIYQTLLSKKIHVFVVEFDQIAPKEASFIESLYHNLRHLSMPLILITNQNENPNSLKIPYHHVYKPIQEKALLNLIAKILSGKNDTAIQRSRRFKTNQKAYVKNLFNHEEETMVEIYNLSKTGAYFELKEKPNWKKDDILSVKIMLENLSIQHELQAKVMWIAEKESVLSKTGIGIQFVSDKDVQKNLLEGLNQAKKFISDL